MSKKTHRTELARRLAAATSLTYQQALSLVREWAENGRLPSRLDPNGADVALARLIAHTNAPERPSTGVPTWADTLLREAVASGVSDLHLTLDQKGTLRVRARILGELDTFRPDSLNGVGRYESVLALAGFTAAREDCPDSDYQEQVCDLGNGSSIPLRSAQHDREGERQLVVRLVTPEPARSLPELGMSPAAVEQVTASLTGRGLVLVLSPTGGGKSTTAESVLAAIPAGVPYDYVGELRSFEDAESAIDAASHRLVVANVHGAAARRGVSRLLRLAPARSVEEVADVLRLVVAQYLVPAVCPKCRSDDEFSPFCKTCRGRTTRVGLFDVLPLDPASVAALADDPAAAVPAQLGFEHGQAHLLAVGHLIDPSDSWPPA
jgi:type II secretory ATPase GspE/PulE/Tfp pilus assembly ATPase PilB-like protein